MADSVLTNAFVNGRWVTQTTSLREILEANSERQRAEEPRRMADIPTIGILSRAVIQSPAVNWILPGRIRDKLKNDIVFVGEDFVHIKEVISGGHLRHITSLTDFESTIRAAKILGQDVRPPKQDPVKLEDQGAAHGMTPLQDIPLKMEEDEGSTDHSLYPAVPPQILILSMASNDLLFLFVHESRPNNFQFHTCTLPLLKERSSLEHPGRYLAVDPYSRAVAVGAYQSTVVIYRTKDMVELKQQFEKQPREWAPFVDERAIKVPGIILKMDFLYPEKDDHDHVILLVVYRSLEQGARIYWRYFEWNHNESLNNLKEGQPMPIGKRRNVPPNLLIPLKQRSSFLLVFEDDIHQFQSPLSGSAESHSFKAFGGDAPREKPQYPGLSARRPLWTQWSRPNRNDSWHENNDAVYIAREDGAIMYLEIPYAGSAAKPAWAGQFRGHLDTAFAYYQQWDPEKDHRAFSSDFLITCGCMSTGQIIRIGDYRPMNENRHVFQGAQMDRATTMTFQFLETMPNWGPTMDLTITNHIAAPSGSSQRKRIYSTAGRQPFGSVAELRSGLEALLVLRFESPDFAGATGLWTTQDYSNDLLIIISLPSETIPFRIVASTGEFDDDITKENCGLEFDERTLAIAPLWENGLVQITERSILVLDTSDPETWLRRIFRTELPLDTRILQTTVHAASGILAIASRREGQAYLQVARIENVPTDASLRLGKTSLHLDHDPTSILLFKIHDKMFLFTALADGSFVIFNVSSEGDLLQTCSQQFDSSPSPDGSSKCDSVILLSYRVDGIDSSGEKHLLACGMRNGSLYAVEIQPNGEVLIDSPKIIQIGHTPVSIVADYDDAGNSALITCGTDICRIKYQGGVTIALEINNVWITDRVDPWLKQPFVSFLHKPLAGPNDYAVLQTAWTCIAEDGLLLMHIGEDVKTVPRHREVQGTPTRILHIEEMDILVVGTVDIEADEKTRYPRAVLQFLRYEADEVEEEPKEMTKFKLSSGEKVNALGYWLVQRSNGRQYTLLLVATGWFDDHGKSRGRLLVLSLNSSADGTITVKVVKNIDHFRAQCTALAVMDETKVVLCSGTNLYLYQLSLEEKKARLLAEHAMECSAMYISVSAELVYISTAQNSLIGMELVKRDGAFSFKIVFNDGQARNSIHHLVVDIPGTTPDSSEVASGSDRRSSTHTPVQRRVVMVSSKDGTVAGLLQPAKQTNQLAARQLFEATLPRSITRLKKGGIRPAWREVRVPGVLVNDIIGTASDGAMYGFSLLDAKAWRLAKFLENLCRWSREMDLRQAARGQDIHVEIDPDRLPTDASRRSQHVNGDMLAAAFLSGAGPARLEKMLTQPALPTHTGEPDPSVDPSDRFDLLRALAVDLLGEQHSESRGLLLERVVAWLRGVLTSVL